MIIAVVTMRMVQVAIDQVVDVIAMRNWLMAAPRAMSVVWVVAFAAVLRSTGIGIRSGHLDDMFIYMIFMKVMQVAVMEVINMVTMHDAGMTTIRAMLVGMISVRVAAHDNLPAVS